MFKCKFTIDNEPYEVEIKAITGPIASVIVNGEEQTVSIDECDQLDGRAEPPAAQAQRAAPRPSVPPPPANKPSMPPAGGDNLIRTPMPGVIIEIAISVGQQIKQGETVVKLESMKMENRIVAPKDGIVKEILIKEGQDIAEHVAIVEYEE